LKHLRVTSEDLHLRFILSRQLVNHKFFESTEEVGVEGVHSVEEVSETVEVGVLRAGNSPQTLTYLRRYRPCACAVWRNRNRDGSVKVDKDSDERCKELRQSSGLGLQLGTEVDEKFVHFHGEDGSQDEANVVE